jgi:DNA-directed RNA polymerase subunit RPC12/RpoP
MSKDKCKKCGSENIILVEYEYTNSEYYDGISEIECKDCGVRIGRWSGKELTDGEIEKRYGGKK